MFSASAGVSSNASHTLGKTWTVIASSLGYEDFARAMRRKFLLEAAALKRRPRG